MKPIFLIAAAFLALARPGFSQGFFVSKVVGQVYHDGKLVSEHENLADLKLLRAASRNAALRVVDPNGASIPIAFARGKAVQVTSGDHKSELYELTVGEYIKQYTTYKSTQGKGGEKFDWFDFFYLAPDDSLPRKMLIVEGERIPRQSTSFNTTKAYQIYATIYMENGDSSSFELPVKRDSIYFPAQAFAGKTSFRLQLSLQSADATGAIKRNRLTDEPIACEFLTTKELDAVIGLFSSKWHDTYKTAADGEKELYVYLIFNYSKIYWPQVKQRADAAFK